MFFTRLVIFILLVLAGLGMMIYTEKIVRVIGKQDLAEKYLGFGGTYNMWKIIGVIVICVATLILMGKFAWVGL